MVLNQNHKNSTLIENALPPKAPTDTIHCIYYYDWVGAMPPTLRTVEYNYSTRQRIPQSYHQVLNITTNIQYLFNSTPGPHTNLITIKSSRRLSLAQGFYDLIGHSGSLCQIMTKFIFSTISHWPLVQARPCGWLANKISPAQVRDPRTDGWW